MRVTLFSVAVILFVVAVGYRQATATAEKTDADIREVAGILEKATANAPPLPAGPPRGTPAVDQYARDVQAQARFLAAQPEVDPARVGISGASQAGWIMPLAASRESAIRFVIGVVSPTLTQGETDLWANLNGQGQSMPTRTDEDMEAEVRAAGPSGVDPMPAVRAMRIPAIWLFGGKDRTVPSRLCVERLDPVAREAGRDFSYRVFPGGTHGLILTANGLQDEAARSDHFVTGLFPAIRDWLAARTFTGSVNA